MIGKSCLQWVCHFAENISKAFFGTIILIRLSHLLAEGPILKKGIISSENDLIQHLQKIIVWANIALFY